MKPRDLAVTLALLRAADLRPLIWGPPGVGKTSLVRDLARGWGEKIVVLQLSQLLPEDVAGGLLPGNGRYITAPPDWADDLRAGGVLFVDELTTAHPRTLDAALNLILERRVNWSTTLPKNVFVVAAANPPEHTNAGGTISPALANRFVHLEWELPAPSDWAKILRGGEMVVPRYEPPVRDQVLDVIDLIAEFLETDGRGMFNASRPVGRAFPTPRSWEAAARFLALAWREKAKSEIVAETLSGIVGEQAATALLAYSKTKRLPTPGEMIEGAEFPEDASAALRVASTLLDEYKRTGDVRLWDVFCRLLDGKRLEVAAPVLDEFAAEYLRRERKIPPRISEWSRAIKGEAR